MKRTSTTLTLCARNHAKSSDAPSPVWLSQCEGFVLLAPYPADQEMRLRKCNGPRWLSFGRDGAGSIWAVPEPTGDLLHRDLPRTTGLATAVPGAPQCLRATVPRAPCSADSGKSSKTPGPSSGRQFNSHLGSSLRAALAALVSAPAVPLPPATSAWLCPRAVWRWCLDRAPGSPLSSAHPTLRYSRSGPEARAPRESHTMVGVEAAGEVKTERAWAVKGDGRGGNMERRGLRTTGEGEASKRLSSERIRGKHGAAKKG